MIRKLFIACAGLTLGASAAFGQQYGQPSGQTYQQPYSQPQQGYQPVAQQGYSQQPQQQGGGVQMVRGNIFAVPVPAGWTVLTETICETYIASPDKSLCFGFTGLERTQVGNSMMFMQKILQMYGCQNVQVLGGKRLPVNGDAIEGVITYTQAGQARKAWVRVLVMAQNGIGNGYMLVGAASPEKFDAAVPSLKALCEKIQIINPSAAFDRARSNAISQGAIQNQINENGARLNQPADSDPTGYWARQKSMDDVAARRSDVTRDQYKYSDTTTGQDYWVGQNAYDPARGGVVNPERPTENLTPEAHWENQ